jgi:hypothetical protein
MARSNILRAVSREALGRDVSLQVAKIAALILLSVKDKPDAWNFTNN